MSKFNLYLRCLALAHGLKGGSGKLYGFYVGNVVFWLFT